MALPTSVKIGTLPTGIPTAGVTGDLVSCTKSTSMTNQAWYILGTEGPSEFTFQEEPASGQMRLAAHEDPVVDDASYLITNLTWTYASKAPDYTDVSWVEI
jgi:hypothetical protein